MGDVDSQMERRHLESLPPNLHWSVRFTDYGSELGGGLADGRGRLSGSTASGTLTAQSPHACHVSQFPPGQSSASECVQETGLRNARGIFSITRLRIHFPPGTLLGEMGRFWRAGGFRELWQALKAQRLLAPHLPV